MITKFNSQVHRSQPSLANLRYDIDLLCPIFMKWWSIQIQYKYLCKHSCKGRGGCVVMLAIFRVRSGLEQPTENLFHILPRVPSP